VCGTHEKVSDGECVCACVHCCVCAQRAVRFTHFSGPFYLYCCWCLTKQRRALVGVKWPVHSALRQEKKSKTLGLRFIV
jgi:hypothetical protein